MAWRRSAARIYRALLLAYPAEFRHEYGAEMERLFEDRLRSEPRYRVWLETLPDVALSATREHLHVLAADLRHGLRVLRKSPAFALVALLVMALGIGGSTAVFSLVNAVLLRSLPYGDADRLVYIWTPNDRFVGAPRELAPSLPDFEEWRRSARSFSDLANFDQRMFDCSIPGSAVERIGGAVTSANFFSVLRTSPQLGTTFEGRTDVAVISDGLWRSRFGADPGVLGKTIHLNHGNFTVVGVMPREFAYPHVSDFPFAENAIKQTDIWIPRVPSAKPSPDRLDEDAVALGRLRPGVDIRQAQAEMAAIEKRLNPLYPELFRGFTILLEPFIASAVGPIRGTLWLLFGAVCIVVLIACSNIANLLAARAAGRAHEMGVRTALGAARARLIRQMLTEALLLASAGGALGIFVGYAAMRALVRFSPGNISRIDETSLDIYVLLFAIALSLITGFAFGLMPAFTASRVDISGVLKQGGNKGSAGASARFRSGLIVAQVALSIVLLSGAGLLMRSYLKLLAVDTGFNASTLTVTVHLGQNYQDPGKQYAFYRDLVSRVGRVPGVQAAGFVNYAPLSSGGSIVMLDVNGKRQTADNRAVTPGYFAAMGIRLVAGRLFNESDLPDRPPIALISDKFAKLYFPGQNPIGQKSAVAGGASRAPVIVGVVADVRRGSLEEEPQPVVYVPLFSSPEAFGDLAIRGSLPENSIAPAVRRIVHAMDPFVALTDIHTMSERVSQVNARRRFQTVVLSIFAAAAVFLALVGLYGVLAYSVKQRNAEIGIRMALGASRAQVLAMILRQGLTLVFAGLALGLACAFALTRLVAAWLYGVSATDPVTFIAVPLFVIVVAAGACLIPARKATLVDPVHALRNE